MRAVKQGGISRRALLAGLASAVRVVADGGDPLRTLRGGHPRLILLDPALEQLRTLIRESAPVRKTYTELQREADRMLTAAPVEYKPASAQSNGQSRRALDRVYTLALLHRLDRKQAYMDRAVKELRAAAAFRDWNPSHYSDVADMAQAFAIGYDWLHPSLTEGDRAWIRSAIVQKSLAPSLAIYRSQVGFTNSRLGTNAACNEGLSLAALAIAEEESDLSGSILRYALDSMPRAMASYAADGSWPEGPAYWDNATRCFVSFAAALQTALGLDFGLTNSPGLAKAGRFRIYFSGPINKTFNFGESGEDIAAEPAMFWLARRYAQPQFAWQEQKFAERAADAEPLDLVWYQREAKAPQGPMWPLDSVFAAPQCAFFRSSWEDPNAVFLAVKGGDNKTPRGHLDLGTFVLDAGGVRWALDLGPDDGAAPPAGRLRAFPYRARSEAHNTVLIDGENQDSRAEARIVRHEFSPDLAWTQIDLSKAYPGRLKQWQRRIGLSQRQTVLLQDVLQADQPCDAQWGMMTGAEIAINGQNAELTQGGWILSAEIQSPRHAVFDVEQTQGPAGVKKLVVRLGDKVTDLDLNISLTPHRAGTQRPKTAVRLPT